MTRLIILAVLGLVLQTAGQQPQAPGGDRGSPVFPRGERFPFMGYSGVPARDANHGFSVAGPSYGADQLGKLAEAEAAGLPYPFMVSIDMKFHARPPDRPLELTPDEIRERITAQVKQVADRKAICWWYLGPEELRWWRANEMAYLEAATAAIRAADPLRRPIWMYEPNHRDAASLAKTGRHLDIIGKGFYTNLAGYKDHRVWVRWSMEQQTKAIEALVAQDARPRIPIVMPELCADPADPAEDHLIPRWTRHDVYLGLMGGGKGVAIWSLFPRHEVRRTWPLWYDSYARIATELTGPLQLGQVFLHGTATSLLEIDVLSGPRELVLTKGARNSLEAGTTAAGEKDPASITYPSLSVAQLDHRGATWIFLCNSSGTEAIKFGSSPLPGGCAVSDVFTGRRLEPAPARLTGTIAPLDVLGFRILR